MGVKTEIQVLTCSWGEGGEGRLLGRGDAFTDSERKVRSYPSRDGSSTPQVIETPCAEAHV